MSVHVLVWERGTLVSLDHKCSWGSFWINFIRFVWRLGRLHFFREIKDPSDPKGSLPLPNRRGSQSGPEPKRSLGDATHPPWNQKRLILLDRNDPSAMQRIHHGIRKGPEPKRSLGDAVHQPWNQKRSNRKNILGKGIQAGSCGGVLVITHFISWEDIPK